MPVRIYGIKNCDTMKKARTWLDQRKVAYTFHDYKTRGLERVELETWVAHFGWERVLNRAGTTFRGLPDGQKQGLDAEKAVSLMLDHLSLIKRPVLALEDGRLLIGFKPEDYAAAIG
ncbi:ArsC family reductase [Methylovirgula sp. 4M-Z18]|uniref:ArsC family reductase n=1 Tax=Methylovirgula sp. 4M-Z18 TaxID=2293567 RepID=UPI000E2FD66A|nr:ArsC family reductase [Methylovirgula sp. 4M-Z18]RFB80706.1 ArsC family reductase [Methylovirgula sp. 4M-Z18]